MSTISISICLSDLPENKIKKAANGKKYINLVLYERKEVGKYNETHTLCVSHTREERSAGAPTIYVGSGTKHAPIPVTPEDIDKMPPMQPGDDDLPF